MSLNSFYKNFIIMLIVLLCSCSQVKEQRKKITIGKTFKINISESISDNNNLVFQWWVGDCDYDDQHSVMDLLMVADLIE